LYRKEKSRKSLILRGSRHVALGRKVIQESSHFLFTERGGMAPA
jgi:hypothetical protein